MDIAMHTSVSQTQKLHDTILMPISTMHFDVI